MRFWPGAEILQLMWWEHVYKTNVISRSLDPLLSLLRYNLRWDHVWSRLSRHFSNFFLVKGLKTLYYISCLIVSLITEIWLFYILRTFDRFIVSGHLVDLLIPDIWLVYYIEIVLTCTISMVLWYYSTISMVY